MTSKFLTCVLTGAAVAAMGVASIAVAKDVDIRKSIKKDTETIVMPHSSFRGDCETKVPVIKIVAAPKSGSTTIKSGKRKFGNSGKGNMAKCNGKTGVASGVFYKPNSGFEGFDTLKYEVTFASGNKNVYVINLRVGSPKQGGDGWVKAK